MCAKSCLHHRFSGFVWQQEARPLHILGTNKPEKPLPPFFTGKFRAHLANYKLPKEKSFHQLCPKLHLKAVLCYRTAGHPARLSHRMGILPLTPALQRGTWLRAATCPALALLEVPAP